MNTSPFVLCLTNTVAANFTANCLLAVGAKPAMIEDPSEAAELAAAADAVLVNLGTVHARQAEAMHRAVGAAKAAGKPWVLDPVAVQFLAYRRELVRELLSEKPTLVRGNEDEIAFLGELDVPSLATAETDVVRDPAAGRIETVAGGVPMLQTVTATGCEQGALCAAFLGRGLKPFEAAVAVSKLVKRAGEKAWEKAKAPGSFQIAFVDALWGLSHD